MSQDAGVTLVNVQNYLFICCFPTSINPLLLMKMIKIMFTHDASMHVEVYLDAVANV